MEVALIVIPARVLSDHTSRLKDCLDIAMVFSFPVALQVVYSVDCQQKGKIFLDPLSITIATSQPSA